jgi:hypothetical protein
MLPVRIRRGGAAVFHWKIQNDGTLFDRIVFAAPRNSAGFAASFYLGAANVTKAVVAGTYAKRLAVGTSLTITLKIAVLTNARVGAVRSELLRVRSMNQPVSDAVLARVTVA